MDERYRCPAKFSTSGLAPHEKIRQEKARKVWFTKDPGLIRPFKPASWPTGRRQASLSTGSSHPGLCRASSAPGSSFLGICFGVIAACHWPPSGIGDPIRDRPCFESRTPHSNAGFSTFPSCSENLDHQRQSVELFRQLRDEDSETKSFPYAVRHLEVERFGRFPTNQILGRVSTPEEMEFLQQPFIVLFWTRGRDLGSPLGYSSKGGAWKLAH